MSKLIEEAHHHFGSEGFMNRLLPLIAIGTGTGAALHNVVDRLISAGISGLIALCVGLAIELYKHHNMMKREESKKQQKENDDRIAKELTDALNKENLREAVEAELQRRNQEKEEKPNGQ